MSKRLDPTRAQLNSTVMIQDIVAILKNPPFNETMTLFSFEEKKEYELLDLIVKVMGMIDTSMKLDNNDTAACLKAVFEFLQILKFPYSSESQLQDDLAKGDKRLLIQILHFLLTGLRTLSDKYYLNKFTAPINISQEYLGDDDILELWNQFKELQAEFTSTYKMLEEKKINAPKIDEIQDDIRKCQNDKLQLSRSIAKHKKDYANKPDFQELFQMTSKLRKEQEQDSNLEKKLAKQQYDIKEAEERLIVAQQRLLDNKKNLDNNISALKLLENARAQRNNNRDAFENLSKYELIDRRNRIKTLEEILQMPEITMSDINDLKAQLSQIDVVLGMVANVCVNKHSLFITSLYGIKKMLPLAQYNGEMVTIDYEMQIPIFFFDYSYPRSKYGLRPGETNDILHTALRCIWDTNSIGSLIYTKGILNNIFGKK